MKAPKKKTRRNIRLATAGLEAVLAGADRWQLFKADVLCALRQLPDASFDALLGDVPYGLGPRSPSVDEIIAYLRGAEIDTGGDFMGKRWMIPSVKVWREAYRVLKPGAHLAVFGGTRTYDLISLGLRAAGFALRDSIEVFGLPPAGPVAHWIQSQGRPKSPSSLSPSHEPVLLFRKPLGGSVADNAARYGTGQLNIDACRTLTDWSERSDAWKLSGHSAKPDAVKIASPAGVGIDCHPAGRWPANIVLCHHQGCKKLTGRAGAEGDYLCHPDCAVRHVVAAAGDDSAAARLFPTVGVDIEPEMLYCAKASRSEREAGCGAIAPRCGIRNTGPCVKPVKLTRWLARLVCPPGGAVLVPYAGTGSEMIGAVLEGARAVGIELDPDDDGYVEIARARIAWWLEHPGGLTPEAVQEQALETRGQQQLFGATAP